MAMSLVLSAGVFSSCGDDEEATTKTETSVDERIKGWTSGTHIAPKGGMSYFQDYYLNPRTHVADTTFVTISMADGLMNILFESQAWGTVEFKGLKATETDSSYVLPSGIESTIKMIPMMSQDNEAKDYAVTLLEGNVAKDLKQLKSWMLKVFINENHGSYELKYHAGKPPAPAVDIAK